MKDGNRWVCQVVIEFVSITGQCVSLRKIKMGMKRNDAASSKGYHLEMVVIKLYRLTQ